MSPDPLDGVERCPHRVDGGPGEEVEQARCRLLERIVEAIGAPGRVVERDACAACVDSFPPSVEDMNPVIASLVHAIAAERAGDESLDQDARRAALALRDRAERCIPVVLPDEEDLPSEILRNPRCDWVEIRSILPPPATRCGPRVAEWAVGVTTAPRRLPTLESCLDGLNGAGWRDPVLFVDAPLGKELPARFAGLVSTVRSPRVGAWPNYYLALAELTLRQPDADVYMILQDDALLFHHPGLREYLEEILWPGDRPGIVSLYCARDYTQGRPGWHELPMRWVWGALAFLFPPEVARRFLADPAVQAHRKTGQSGGLSGIDLIVGSFAFQNEVPVSFPTPSLVQHIGQVSTIWETARAAGSRKAVRFAGDLAARADGSAGNSLAPGAGLASRIGGVRFVRSLDGVLGRRTHRSGWPFAFAALQPLAAEQGPLLDDSIEQTFLYGARPRVHEQPWIGIVHQPPNLPPFVKPEHTLHALFRLPEWRRSAAHLLGVIALSGYLAAYLAEVLGVPTCVVKHPTEIPGERWSLERHKGQGVRRLVQVGWYLKNTQLIYQLPEARPYRKLRLLASDEQVQNYDRRVRRYWSELGRRSAGLAGGVEDLGRVSAAVYDELLAASVVIAEVFDASANNVVIECIARTTPIVINRHPAVVEYLGADYPLYFSDPAEVPDLLAEQRVQAAHEYLSGLDRSWLSGTFFRESIRAFVGSLVGREAAPGLGAARQGTT